VDRLAGRETVAIWSIGMYSGESPFHFSPVKGATNPVLTHLHVTDIPAVFVADPFMIEVNGTWYMFFEVINRNTAKGEIGLATSGNGMNWKYQKIVLAESFHLSYPYVFEWMGDYYMIPETYQAGAVRLYRADTFPTDWSHYATLLSGPYFVDISVFRYDQKWWFFTETNDFRHDTLRLYYATGLLGPWVEHPKSPIIQGNAHIARPAWRVLVNEGNVIRYTQDCFPSYGREVRAFEITELTTAAYRERRLRRNPILRASSSGWNAWGMHHIDPHKISNQRWLACVDGCGNPLSKSPNFTHDSNHGPVTIERFDGAAGAEPPTELG
jgi:hypothetical protein